MALGLWCTIPLRAAPAPEGLLEGRVLDPSGAAVVGARVIVTSNAVTISTTGTDAKGEFRVELPPGSFTVTIAAQGFRDATREIVVSPGPAERIAIDLQLATRNEMVTVSETASYQVTTTSSATRVQTPLIDVPQAVSVITGDLVKDQMMMSIGDVVRYMPGVTAIQGENNRDQVVMRGNSSSADFFVNGLRDDVQYYRDLYNTESVEALKGPNAMSFGR